MSSFWCDNPHDHRRQAERDFERRGRPDDEMYRERHYDECARIYAEKFDECRRNEREEREDEERAQRRAEQQRHEEETRIQYEQEQYMYEQQQEEIVAPEQEPNQEAQALT